MHTQKPELLPLSRTQTSAIAHVDGRLQMFWRAKTIFWRHYLDVSAVMPDIAFGKEEENKYKPF